MCRLGHEVKLSAGTVVEGSAGRLFGTSFSCVKSPLRLDGGVHPVWSRALAVFWVLTCLGLLSVAISSDIIGRPLWWADDRRWSSSLLYLWGALCLTPSALLVVLSLRRGPALHWGAWIVGLELAALAFVDRHDSPGSAVILVVLAVASLFAGVASLAARVDGVDDERSHRSR